MKVLQINNDSETLNHIQGPGQADYTLCGLETDGDSGINIKAGVLIDDKPTCPHCIGIVKYCQTIKL